MTLAYDLVDLEQGTPEWLDFRRDKIGASHASTIMDKNPWKTRYQLWKQYMDGSGDVVNAAMRKGTALEPIARQLFIEQTGIMVRPVVAISKERPWQIASLDGLSEDGMVMVEIKCGNEDLYLKALGGEVPAYYGLQVQHQHSVISPLIGYYCCFYDGKIVVLEVKRDVVLIQELLKEEEEFWGLVMSKQPPELSDRDYEVVEHKRGSELLREYISLSEQEKDIDKRKGAIKAEIIEIGPGRNFILDSTKVYEKSNVSYDTKKMREDGVDVDKYRKISKPYWTISTPRSQASI